eukprot:GHVR01029588.1.p1 GENE.GHVR01029588.1~~GHVR01029588.1.p1  ORF type:complete len:191 (+),score=12.83 GHVR01029588.1:594-1166(+)
MNTLFVFRDGVKVASVVVPTTLPAHKAVAHIVVKPLSDEPLVPVSLSTSESPLSEVLTSPSASLTSLFHQEDNSEKIGVKHITGEDRSHVRTFIDGSILLLSTDANPSFPGDSGGIVCAYGSNSRSPYYHHSGCISIKEHKCRLAIAANGSIAPETDYLRSLELSRAASPVPTNDSFEALKTFSESLPDL